MNDASPAGEQAEVRSRRGLRLLLGSIGLAVFAVALVILVWGDDLLLAAARARFAASPSAPAPATPRDRAEADRQDLEALAAFAGSDASLTPESRAAFEVDRGALVQRAGTLTEQQLAIGVARAVARAGNWQSAADLAASPLFDRLPVRFGWFTEGLFVVAVQPPAEALLGTRVDAIAGKPPEELAASYRALRGGGTPAGARADSLWFLSSPAALRAAGLAPDGDLGLRVTFRDGSSREVALPAGAKAGAWHELPEAGRALSQLEPGRAFLGRLVSDGLYLRLGRIADDEHGRIATQFEETLARFAPGTLRWAVLDLRWSGGGDYTLLLEPMRDLPRWLSAKGHLYVLTGPRTVGAGMIVASWAKALVGARTIIEGEPAGDALQFWSAEGSPLRLPNSRLEIAIATADHDLVQPCRRLDCFWPDYVYGIASGGLAPGVLVHWRFEDYRQGLDPLLQRLGDMIRVPELGARTP